MPASRCPPVDARKADVARINAFENFNQEVIMSADKKTQSDLSNLKGKLKGAREAANTPKSRIREKADLRLLEQEVVAQRLNARRPQAPSKPEASHVDAKLDKALRDSFPGSDPVSSLEAAAFQKSDHTLGTAKTEPVKTKT